MMFIDRHDAGRRLARALSELGPWKDPLVLGLARGGVPVAYEVARALRAPLDVFVVRKLGVPGHQELAMGAIAPGGIRILNREILDALEISPEVVDQVAGREQHLLAQRQLAYRGSTRVPSMTGHTVLLVDDGLATGASMKAAVQAVRSLGADHVVVAVPVASKDTCAELREHADDIVCAVTPEPFASVGRWYRDFAQSTDAEVRTLLEASASWVEALRQTGAPPSDAGSPPGAERTT